ncbi:DNA-binding protein [Pseudoduganella sp. SL102]|uniref:DNA-binding protein n=1 Tax=Pseudoduganella sp. SL102 TaxID=2995154 RepID=UPI00248BDF43|nr:DNA-binding protein [Pseudoduganella sp. SL102]WBS01076.1 DNA-binding protein [Pseudoduganella sp. SL102]
MARNGLTKHQVKAIRDQLLAAGRYPSADAVRQALGDTGSKSTIHRYLKELAGEDPDSAARRGETEHALLALVAQLADRLHADAEGSVQALLAERERALRRKDEELAELRRTVAALSARVATLEGQGTAGADGAVPRERPAPRTGRIEGFGDFGTLLSNSRCGHRDSSPFSILLAGGRSEVIADGTWPQGPQPD